MPTWWKCVHGCIVSVHGDPEPPGHFCTKTPRIGRDRSWLKCREQVENPYAKPEETT